MVFTLLVCELVLFGKLDRLVDLVDLLVFLTHDHSTLHAKLGQQVRYLTFLPGRLAVVVLRWLPDPVAPVSVNLLDEALDARALAVGQSA